MIQLRRTWCIAIVVGCLFAAAGLPAPAASAAPRWASASRATIHPGVRTETAGVFCRAGFVFYDAQDVYISQAAHCSAGPSLTPKYGCAQAASSLGRRVRIAGASRHGTVVYNSWETMGRLFETDRAACSFNDFSLVRIDKVDRAKVNPSVPFWGGPVAGSARSSFGDNVFSFGQPRVDTMGNTPSVGVDQAVPRAGVDTGSSHIANAPPWGYRPDGVTAGWLNYIHTAPVGFLGDKGNAVLDARGRALGLVWWPTHDAADRVVDLTKAMGYMRAKTSLDAIRLATGTTDFVPPR